VADGPLSDHASLCIWCDEPLNDVHPIAIHTLENGIRYQHRECALREVLGGIGHHIAHEYWCLVRHDPDAGLSRRVSAMLVADMYGYLGDEMVTRQPAASAPASDEGDRQELPPPSSDDAGWTWGEDLVWADAEDPPPYPHGWLPPRPQTDQGPGSGGASAPG
jgi:hypothetical protein